MAIGAVSIRPSDWVPPVGWFVTFGDGSSPAERWADTSWMRVKDRFLLGASDNYPVGSTGGSATHGLTVPEMPTHTHSVTIGSAGAHSHVFPICGSDYVCNWNNSYWWRPKSATRTTSTGGAHTHTITAASVGEGIPFDILNPYTAKNVWRRVA